ncbi:LexA family transcriptional regulator [uncultured Allofournierella sp.]|uniref:LexA family protein n=1 Tax=uncultured Allofournierella sp. TaxID=1940258 RepID=UPI0025EFB676|nr:S24 family peptidase [uncultured Fournierella sp.]
MSEETMVNIISFINQYFCDKHTISSIGKIAQGVGIPKSTAYRYLVEMDNRGMIEYDGKNRTISTPMIRKFAPASSLGLLVGSTTRRAAQTETEHAREYISLPISLFGKGEFFILEASDDSMVDAGIDPGDLVVVRTDCTAEVGDIVVALTGDNESTLKVFGGVDEETKNAILEYRNQAKYPNQKIFASQRIVRGIVKRVIKALEQELECETK